MQSTALSMRPSTLHLVDLESSIKAFAKFFEVSNSTNAIFEPRDAFAYYRIDDALAAAAMGGQNNLLQQEASAHLRNRHNCQ